MGRALILLYRRPQYSRNTSANIARKPRIWLRCAFIRLDGLQRRG